MLKLPTPISQFQGVFHEPASLKSVLGCLNSWTYLPKSQFLGFETFRCHFRFQHFEPTFGGYWDLRPTFGGGHLTFLYTGILVHLGEKFHETFSLLEVSFRGFKTAFRGIFSFFFKFETRLLVGGHFRVGQGFPFGYLRQLNCKINWTKGQ